MLYEFFLDAFQAFSTIKLFPLSLLMNDSIPFTTIFLKIILYIEMKIHRETLKHKACLSDQSNFHQVHQSFNSFPVVTTNNLYIVIDLQ
jgi:hypothetical protein